MKTSIPGISAFLLLLGVSAPAAADWYQVEVIVFRNIHPETDGEFWDANPGLPEREGSIQLLDYEPAGVVGGTVPPAPVPYQALPEARYRLDGVERALKQSPEYRPLLHVAWQQPARGADRSRSVHLDFPQTTATSVAETGISAEAPAPQLLQVPDPVLDGTVRLRVGRFLHVDVDMAYFPEQMPAAAGPPPVPPAPSPAQHSIRLPEPVPADYVRLRHSRKILLNELHYIDHPLFGIVVQVTRMQLPDTLPATPQPGL